MNQQTDETYILLDFLAPQRAAYSIFMTVLSDAGGHPDLHSNLELPYNTGLNIKFRWNICRGEYSMASVAYAFFPFISHLSHIFYCNPFCLTSSIAYKIRHCGLAFTSTNFSTELTESNLPVTELG